MPWKKTCHMFVSEPLTAAPGRQGLHRSEG